MAHGPRRSLALLLVCLLLAARADPAYGVGAVAIAVLPVDFVPTAMDESGRVAGYTRRPLPEGELPKTGTSVVDTDAVVWADGVLTALLPAATGGSIAADLVAGGPVVGIASGAPYSEGQDVAVRWDGGVPTVFGPGWATAANAAGAIAVTEHTTPDWFPGVWAADGTLTRVPLPPELAEHLPYASDINDAGWVVGTTNADPSERVAWLWDGADVHILPPPEWTTEPVPQNDGSYRPRAGTTAAWAVNAAGWVVGWAADAGEFPRAVLWRVGEAIDLGAPIGAVSMAVAVGDDGRILVNVGSPGNDRGSSPARAFVWEDDRLTELATLGGDWTRGADLNAAGQVVGQAKDRDGTMRAVVWTLPARGPLEGVPAGKADDGQPPPDRPLVRRRRTGTGAARGRPLRNKRQCPRPRSSYGPQLPRPCGRFIARQVHHRTGG